jgi:hypothetical protein
MGSLFLLAAGWVFGQQPASGPTPGWTPLKDVADKEKLKLGELLDKALKDNPDVRVAEAKVREAEAELNRARLLVAQKVMTFSAALDAARKAAEEAEARMKRINQLRTTNLASAEEAKEAETVLARAKAALAKVEAEMPYLIGKQSAATYGAEVDYFRALQLQGFGEARTHADEEVSAALALRWLAQHQAAGSVLSGPVPEKIRKALDKPISVDFKSVPFVDVLQNLQDLTGINIRNQISDRYKDGNPPITLKLQELPLRAVLQALQDEYPEGALNMGGLRFVVREYGILVTFGNKLPPGAALATDFRDSESGGDPFRTTSSGRNTSPNVEGMIKAVDEKAGLVTISIGSDAGIAKDHTLDVYRLTPTPKYLGTVTILDVQPTEAVGKPQTKEKIQAGDKVAGSISRRGH